MDLSPQLEGHELGHLVQRVFGAGVTIRSARRIRPWTVVRCELADADVSTVIVKWLRSNPQGFRTDRRQIETEAAALEWLGQVVPGVAPRLFGHDAARGLLLIEDLAPRRTLHSMLSTGISPRGVTGLHSFAATMARLHTATAACTSEHQWDRTARVPIGWPAAVALLERLAELAAPSPGVYASVQSAIAATDEPGPFEAFSNGDSGANNCLVGHDGRDGRLIDFEHACRRHLLLDVAALHVPGSMWMTVADPVPLGVEDTYRHAAAEVIPAVSDDGHYGAGLAAACSTRTLNKLLRFDKLDARSPGHHSRRQLVTTIERTISTLERWRELPSVSGWLVDVAGALRRRWPDADVVFPDDYSLREPFDPDH